MPALRELLELTTDDLWLVVENSAGAGGTIGRSTDELAAIFDALDRHPRLGLCLDSCHWYVSGIDVTDRDALDAAVAEVDARIGLDRLRCLHVNDSKAELGSNRDRHDAVGEGLLGDGLGTFLAHPAFQDLPALLETGRDDGRIDRDDLTAPPRPACTGARRRGASRAAVSPRAERRRGSSGSQPASRRTPGLRHPTSSTRCS